MNRSTVLQIIQSNIDDIRASQGLSSTDIVPETILLDGALDVDSLDLAGLVIALEEATNRDPFGGGFIDFRTAGELADLFAVEGQ
jgi:acyl carrier protein